MYSNQGFVSHLELTVMTFLIIIKKRSAWKTVYDLHLSIQNFLRSQNQLCKGYFWPEDQQLGHPTHMRWTWFKLGNLTLLWHYIITLDAVYQLASDCDKKGLAESSAMLHLSRASVQAPATACNNSGMCLNVHSTKGAKGCNTMFVVSWCMQAESVTSILMKWVCLSLKCTRIHFISLRPGTWHAT